MARKIRLFVLEVKLKKVLIVLSFVSWISSLSALAYYRHSSTNSIKFFQTLPRTRWNDVSPSIHPEPRKYNEGKTVNQQSLSQERVTSIVSRTAHPPRERPEQFIPFRYRFPKSYFKNIHVGTDNLTDKSGYLIYRCDRDVLCGGWADRLKGIMAAYVIANLTGRVFKWEILSPPCDLQKFIVPNLVNWSHPVSFHSTVVNESSDVQKLKYLDSRKFWTNVKNIDFTSLPAMKAKFVYYISNLDHMDGFRDSIFFQTQLSWMKNLTRDQINAVVFKRLFKMSPKFETQLNSFLSRNLSPWEKLVCIHIRTGRNPTIPNDSADRVREDDLPKIWKFLRGISEEEHDKIFLMSDSENVIADAKKQSFGSKMFISNGKIVHVEKSKVSDKEKCAGMEKALLEQFVLMHCDSLVISKSGLSRMPAYVRGSDEGLYCLLEKGKVVPCKAREAKALYGIMG